MSTTVFDTLAYAKKLKAVGVPEAQAEAQAEALAEAITTELATKTDLAELKVDMIKWIVGVGLAELAMLVGIFTKLPH